MNNNNNSGTKYISKECNNDYVNKDIFKIITAIVTKNNN